MTGGLMQLVAYGAQDIYLTGDPQITYFKMVYRRHTNFAVEAIEQTFNGTADFGKKVTCLIARNGDLISSMYLEIVLPQVTTTSGSFRWIDNIGHHIIDEVEIQIGGQRIDRQTGTWMQIYHELTTKSGHTKGYLNMIGHQDAIYNGLEQTNSLQAWSADNKDSYTMYIPLQFWFCRNIGLALPLIALQYHEVKLDLTFRRVNECYIAGNSDTASTQSTYSSLSLESASLWVDYVYLDTDERRRFAQISHEYLIDQLQFQGAESLTSTDNKVRMNFNHPVKEIVWVVQHDNLVALPGSFTDVNQGNQWSNFTNHMAEVDDDHSNPTGSANPVTQARIQLNGHDRFKARKGTYFNWVQPYQHHTNITKSPGINVYSFGFNPEDPQPSGTCNFSRIDNAVLQVKISFDSSLVGTSCKIYVFAVNFNILRIMSGMGGLAYSN